MPPKKRSRKSSTAKGSKTKKAKKQVADADMVAAVSIVPVEAKKKKKQPHPVDRCTGCKKVRRLVAAEVMSELKGGPADTIWACKRCIDRKVYDHNKYAMNSQALETKVQPIIQVAAPRTRKNDTCSRCHSRTSVTERFDEETSRIRWYCGECMGVVKEAEQKIRSGEWKSTPMSAKTLKDIKANIGGCTVCGNLATRTQVEDDTEEKTLHLCAVCLPSWCHNKKIPEEAKVFTGCMKAGCSDSTPCERCTDKKGEAPAAAPKKKKAPKRTTKSEYKKGPCGRPGCDAREGHYAICNICQRLNCPNDSMPCSHGGCKKRVCKTRFPEEGPSRPAHDRPYRCVKCGDHLCEDHKDTKCRKCVRLERYKENAAVVAAFKAQVAPTLSPAAKAASLASESTQTLWNVECDACHTPSDQVDKYEADGKVSWYCSGCRETAEHDKRRDVAIEKKGKKKAPAATISKNLPVITEEKKERDTSKYLCGVCNVRGVKLWRYLNSSHVDLSCARCLCEEYKYRGKDYASNIDADGMRMGDPAYGEHGLTDTIGNNGPACISFNGSCWSYGGSSEAWQDAQKWWKALPTYAHGVAPEKKEVIEVPPMKRRCEGPRCRTNELVVRGEEGYYCYACNKTGNYLPFGVGSDEPAAAAAPVAGKCDNCSAKRPLVPITRGGGSTKPMMICTTCAPSVRELVALEKQTKAVEGKGGEKRHVPFTMGVTKRFKDHAECYGCGTMDRVAEYLHLPAVSASWYCQRCMEVALVEARKDEKTKGAAGGGSAWSPSKVPKKKKE
jgi:hypothetical protein